MIDTDLVHVFSILCFVIGRKQGFSQITSPLTPPKSLNDPHQHFKQTPKNQGNQSTNLVHVTISFARSDAF